MFSARFPFASGPTALCFAVLASVLAAQVPPPPQPVQPDAPSDEIRVTRIQDPEERGFVSIFNGRDLEGWTPKFTGHELGVNLNDTFRVRDGVLAVSYDDWEGDFGGQFGHLFFEAPFSHYVMRFEYRFLGEQVKGGAGWALRNSGVMVHGQPADTMGKGQQFPVSIEVQLLGGPEEGQRTTGNLCTPGTNVVYEGKLDRRHCISSRSETFRGDGWVACEIEVHGGGVIRHKIGGRVVMEYRDPQLDPRDGDAKKFIEARGEGADLILRSGSISLQAESHPCEFRNLRIKALPIEEETPAAAPTTSEAGGRKDGEETPGSGRR